jgi:transposase-like protein
MAYIVKCPICGSTKKIDGRVKHFFRCYRCNVQIELKPNIIAESFVLPKKDKENTVIVEIIPDNEWKHSEGVIEV